MAEPQEASTVDGGASARKRGAPPVLVMLLVLCCMASLVVSILALLSRPKAGHAQASGKEKAKAVARHPRERHDLGEFLVNLADPDGQAYVKTTMVLEYETGEKAAKGGHGEAAAPEWEAPVRDAIVSTISQCHRAELRTQAGKDGLKKRILERVNRAEREPGQRFVAVYFTSFAMQ